jgi:hypothetical protein
MPLPVVKGRVRWPVIERRAKMTMGSGCGSRRNSMKRTRGPFSFGELRAHDYKVAARTKLNGMTGR